MSITRLLRQAGLIAAAAIIAVAFGLKPASAIGTDSPSTSTCAGGDSSSAGAFRPVGCRTAARRTDHSVTAASPFSVAVAHDAPSPRAGLEKLRRDARTGGSTPEGLGPYFTLCEEP